MLNVSGYVLCSLSVANDISLEARATPKNLSPPSNGVFGIFRHLLPSVRTEPRRVSHD